MLNALQRKALASVLNFNEGQKDRMAARFLADGMGQYLDVSENKDGEWEVSLLSINADGAGGWLKVEAIDKTETGIWFCAFNNGFGQVKLGFLPTCLGVSQKAGSVSFADLDTAVAFAHRAGGFKIYQIASIQEIRARKAYQRYRAYRRSNTVIASNIIYKTPIKLENTLKAIVQKDADKVVSWWTSLLNDSGLFRYYKGKDCYSLTAKGKRGGL